MQLRKQKAPRILAAYAAAAHACLRRAGVRRDLSEVRPGTDGKITMTALQRQRAAAVTPRISFSSVKTDVFGYAPVVVSTLETLREQERTDVFQKVLKKSKAKYEDKQRLYRRVRADGSKPICFIDSKEMKRVKKKDDKKKRAFASSNVVGEGRLTWKQLCASMGGSGHPWFFVGGQTLREWQRSDPACLDIDVGGKRFGDNVESDVLAYVRSTKALTRRIMLVDNIDAVPPHVKFAAAIVRARVQEQVDRPLLQFSLRAPVCICFTKAFSQAEKLVVGVARSARLRMVDDVSFKTVEFMSWRDFWKEFAKRTAKEAKTFHCIYKDRDDPQLQGLSEAQVGASRSFDEFFSKVASGRAALLKGS